MASSKCNLEAKQLEKLISTSKSVSNISLQHCHTLGHISVLTFLDTSVLPAVVNLSFIWLCLLIKVLYYFQLAIPLLMTYSSVHHLWVNMVNVTERCLLLTDEQDNIFPLVHPFHMKGKNCPAGGIWTE